MIASSPVKVATIAPPFGPGDSRREVGHGEDRAVDRAALAAVFQDDRVARHDAQVGHALGEVLVQGPMCGQVRVDLLERNLLRVGLAIEPHELADPLAMPGRAAVLAHHERDP